MLKNIFKKIQEFFFPNRPPTNWERFTEGARNVLVYGQHQAEMMKHVEIDPEHILIGLIQEKDGVASKVLSFAGVTPEKIQTYIKANPILFNPLTDTDKRLLLGDRIKKVLENAVLNARVESKHSIDTEDLLIGVLDDTKIKPLLDVLKVDNQYLRDRTNKLSRERREINRDD